MLRFAYHLKSRNYGRDRSLITGSGGGGGAESSFTPTKKGDGKSFSNAVEKGGGGGLKVLSSFYAGVLAMQGRG